MTNTREPYDKPKGAKSFWLQTSGSLGLLSIIIPNSHKSSEGNWELRSPAKLTEVGRLP
jgi:hypothetical protein